MIFEVVTLRLGLKVETGLGVGDLDTKGLGLLNDLKALSRRNVVGNLSSIGLAVEEEKVEVSSIADEENLVARGNHVLGLLVRTVTNLWHRDGTAESTTNARIDTTGLAPRLANTSIAIRVVSLELLRVLLNDLGVGKRSSHLELENILSTGHESPYAYYEFVPSGLHPSQSSSNVTSTAH
jgi:hypothetical protein